MGRKTKITLLVEDRILAEGKQLVGQGRYRSLNTCVNEALRVLLAYKRHARFAREMEEARRDDEFLADIKATMEDFDYADAEAARRLA